MQLLDIVKKGSTDRSVTIRIIDSTTGVPETAVEHDTSGIDLWYRREAEAKTSITEAALAALTTAHTDGGIEHIGDGYYRLDLPDAAFATAANHVDVGGTVTDMIVIGGRVRLVNYDPEDTVRLGLTALPNAAADAAGGLPISDAGGLDVDTLLGRITANVATASALTTAQTAITAINKSAFLASELAIGTVTSQTVFILTGGPANDIANVMAIFFDASASETPVVAEGSYVGSTGTLTLTAVTPITVTTSDTVTLVAVAAASTSVNVTQWGGTAVASANVLIDGAITAAKIASDAITDAKVASDVTIASVTGAVGSVTGAVGSVTGNVGGNVTGSVGSLVGHTVQTGDSFALIGATGSGLTSLATAANLATVAGYLDTEIAAILAGTNELQTDWANGGRLDLILDTAAAGGGLDAAGVRAAVGLASANLDTQLGDIPTVAEFDARTLVAASYATPTNITSATGVVLATASPTSEAIADAVLDELLSGHAIAGSLGAGVSTAITQTTSAAIKAAARLGVEGTWEDEIGGSFVLTING